MIKDIDREKFKQVWQRILSADRILLVSHINPDVDALSSLGVLMDVLKNNNKEFLALADKKSDDYYYLPHFEDIISSKEDLKKEISKKFNSNLNVADDFLKYFDLLITLDCGSIERTSIGDNIYLSIDMMTDLFIVEIDHHIPVKTYANIEIKIPTASTTELLYYFLKENNIKINKNIANCILAGIMTDTGNFLYSSTSDNTLKISAEMMSLGAQFPKILNNTWRNKNFEEMKIWGRALDNLKINKKYSIAYSVLSYEDLESFEDKSSEIFGDIISFMSNLSSADFVMLIREEERGKIKGSFRVGSSDKDVDVAHLASFVGGGGHKKAAGFSLEGSIVELDNSFKIV